MQPTYDFIFENMDDKQTIKITFVYNNGTQVRKFSKTYDSSMRLQTSMDGRTVQFVNVFRDSDKKRQEIVYTALFHAIRLFVARKIPYIKEFNDKKELGITLKITKNSPVYSTEMKRIQAKQSKNNNKPIDDKKNIQNSGIDPVVSKFNMVKN